jgi:hypothetical protein
MKIIVFIFFVVNDYSADTALLFVNKLPMCDYSSIGHNALTADVLRVLLGEGNHFITTLTGLDINCLRNHPLYG